MPRKRRIAKARIDELSAENSLEILIGPGNHPEYASKKERGRAFWRHYDEIAAMVHPDVLPGILQDYSAERGR